MDNNIKGLFVTYEIALKLKEKGFNEQCLAFFNGVGDDMLQPIDTDFINFREIGECIAAPLWQQVIDWLEREHWVDFWAVPILTPNPKQYECFIMYRGKEISCDILGIRFFNSYNDARQTAVEKILKHI
jgi:hypothetical protein